MFTEPIVLAPVAFSSHSGLYESDPAIFNEVVASYPPHLADALVLAVEERTGLSEESETYYRLVVLLAYFLTEERKSTEEKWWVCPRCGNSGTGGYAGHTCQ